MNQTEIRELRERLEARTVGEEDHPIVLWIIAGLWVVLFVSMSFL